MNSTAAELRIKPYIRETPLERNLPSSIRAEFLGTMRDKVEEVLQQLADVIEEAPAGRLAVADEARIAESFTQLGHEAVEIGLRMRRATDQDSIVALEPPRGEWARRFRRMHALDIAFLAAAARPLSR